MENEQNNPTSQTPQPTPEPTPTPENSPQSFDLNQTPETPASMPGSMSENQMMSETPMNSNPLNTGNGEPGQITEPTSQIPEAPMAPMPEDQADKKKVLIKYIAIGAGIIVVLAIAYFAYSYFAGGSGEGEAEEDAPPSLELNNSLNSAENANLEELDEVVEDLNDIYSEDSEQPPSLDIGSETETTIEEETTDPAEEENTETEPEMSDAENFEINEENRIDTEMDLEPGVDPGKIRR